MFLEFQFNWLASTEQPLFCYPRCENTLNPTNRYNFKLELPSAASTQSPIPNPHLSIRCTPDISTTHDLEVTLRTSSPLAPHSNLRIQRCLRVRLRGCTRHASRQCSRHHQVLRGHQSTPSKLCGARLLDMVVPLQKSSSPTVVYVLFLFSLCSLLLHISVLNDLSW